MTEVGAWRSYIEGLLPQPRLRPGGNNEQRKEIKRVILFGRHPNPTADYYFLARLSAMYGADYHLADIRNADFAELDPEGAFIIICRYASSRVLNWISKNDGVLAGVGLFLDDNIPAIITGEDADLHYRFFLFYRALLPLQRLNRYLDFVWVSTPRLARSLDHVSALVLPPSPPRNLWDTPRSINTGQDVLIAYHATSVHYSEHMFLRPVIAKVLVERPQARFEVFASKRAAGIWQDMERVVVRAPTTWSEYLEETRERTIDIMLVPLTPSIVNDCRSPTKRIDVARAGAAAIFSACEAYGFSGKDGEIILPHEPDAWVQAIVELADRPELRKEVANATRMRVEAMHPTSLWHP